MGPRRALVVAALALAGCGSKAEDAPTAVCDEACRDGIAVRALREELKLVYNLTLQGKPVGPQDATTPCPLGGSARVTGTATSNAMQGATDVDLVLELDHCAYRRTDDKPESTYDVTITGAVTERGILAVQPSATTALVFESDAITIEGTVGDPPAPYLADACPLKLGQSGGSVAGKLCGRDAGFAF